MENSRVLAHRGVWYCIEDQNTPKSIKRSFELGFGIETDLRFSGNKIVISHDPVVSDSQCEIEPFLRFDSLKALNIKEDGISNFIFKRGLDLGSLKCFLFDGSIPEMLTAKQLNIDHALRISEYETHLPWKPEYVWLDSFRSDWWINDIDIFKTIENHRTVIVSPEFHKREYRYVWDKFKFLLEEINSETFLCTDKPELFMSYL